MATEPMLVLGANGQVGHELVRCLAPLGRVIALDRHAADLADPEALRAVVLARRPRVIVNAAAYTAVDRAESDAATAEAVNAVAPGVLAEVAQALGALLVHYSTDYVFDGERRRPYAETDLPNPRSVYGRTKLAGEAAVAHAPRHLILRTSWVYGAHGANFLKTMLRLAAERDQLRVVADQVGAPTSAALIASVTARLVAALAAAPEDDPRYGIYHLAAAGETSWHGYARYVIAQAIAAGWPLKAGPDAVAAIATADYPVAARRPANSCLDTTKLRQTFGVVLPDWHVGVDAVLAELNAKRTRTVPPA